MIARFDSTDISADRTQRPLRKLDPSFPRFEDGEADALGGVAVQTPRDVTGDDAVGRRREGVIAVVVRVTPAAGLRRLDDVVRLAGRDVVQAERRPVPP